MPLTLVNGGRATLKIPAYLPICQLLLVPLSGRPNRIYGEPSLASKYINDDGGPSYWWRDKVVRRLLSRLGKNDLGQEVQERLLERIGVPPDDVLERLERLVDNMPHRALSSADELLAVFTKREDRLRMRDKLLGISLPGTFGVLAATSVGILFVQPYTGLHWVVWLLTIASAVPATLAAVWKPGPYFGTEDLKALDAERTRTGATPRSQRQ